MLSERIIQRLVSRQIVPKKMPSERVTWQGVMGLTHKMCHLSESFGTEPACMCAITCKMSCRSVSFSSLFGCRSDSSSLGFFTASFCWTECFRAWLIRKCICICYIRAISSPIGFLLRPASSRSDPKMQRMGAI